MFRKTMRTLSALTVLPFLVYIFVAKFYQYEPISTRKSASVILSTMPNEKVDIFTKEDNTRNLTYPCKQKYRFNCTNMDTIKIIKRNVGRGISKTIDIGVFAGKFVALKRLSPRKKYVPIVQREAVFLKEILIRDQLDHPAIIKMLGYCVKSLRKDSYKLSQTGDITAVYEYGKEFKIKDLSISVFSKVRHAINLVNLLQYFDKSPLGSLKLGDFKEEHFLMVNGTIKLIDLDFVHNIEHPCNFSSQCDFNVRCHNRSTAGQKAIKVVCSSKNKCFTGICTGYNAAYNIQKVNKTFLRYLLEPKAYPSHLKGLVSSISRKLEYGNTNAQSLGSDLKLLMLRIYLHLNSHAITTQNMQSDHITKKIMIMP